MRLPLKIISKAGSCHDPTLQINFTLASPGIQTAYLKPRAFLTFHHTTQSLVKGTLFFNINSEIDL
jgi:hypothetical protein